MAFVTRNFHFHADFSGAARQKQGVFCRAVQIWLIWYTAKG